MRRLLFYVVGCVGAAGAVLALIWALHGFVGPGLPLVAMIAMSLGMVLSVALAMGLMALLFYSDRSGYDETIYRGDLTDGEAGKKRPSR